MVRLRTDGLSRSIAWPSTALFSDHQLRAFAGFCMPRVPEEFQPAHRVYSPADRRTLLPNVDWRFLVSAAANACHAVNTVHRAGHVVGDLNHSNVLISNRALVHLIDADSMQIGTDKKLYYCNVGVPEFTAPELQGRRLTSVRRTVEHDRFALAVLVFQLLFMGRHPFSGNHRDGPLPLQEAVKFRRFVYSARIDGASRPPTSLELGSVGPSLANVFERSFTGGSSRPTAEQIRASLIALGRALERCPRNPRALLFTLCGPLPLVFLHRFGVRVLRRPHGCPRCGG